MALACFAFYFVWLKYDLRVVVYLKYGPRVVTIYLFY
jgi:hypothetical protein